MNPEGSGRRVSLVTGCGKPEGIGAETARLLAAAGIIVVVSDITQRGVDNALGARSTDAGSGLETLVHQIESDGGVASSVCGDVSNEADATGMVQEIVDRHGRLDILVNNAGSPHGADRADIEQVPLEAWEKVMAVNIRGVFLMSRAVIGQMRRRRWGRIINVASAIVRSPRPNRVAYTASKAAIIGFTRALALDVASAGITVNAVCPGSTETSRLRSSLIRAGYTDIDVGLMETARGVPVGRHGRPYDIAAVIRFLSSDEAEYMTGQSLFVDGGGQPDFKS
jgi:3-oxoacyl-[acyl-carrier protein] reductase